jgi:two-component system cell cycle sensor histidine kinase/response regulator CckA
VAIVPSLVTRLRSALALELTPLTDTRVRAYGLAVATTAASVATTRFTWPLMAGTPFVALFGGVVVTTHFGTGSAGLLAILLAVCGAPFAFPVGSPPPWDPRALVVFILVAVLANRIVSGRNRAEYALRISEQKLRRAQKMEVVGQLVAGVAHNFNNLLAITMGYTDLLLESDRGRALDRADLGEIRKATERGAALIRQLLAFGRKHDGTLAHVDVNRMVAGLREMLNRVIREDIELTIEVAPVPVAILIDPHDLEQMILNLVINARDALPVGGKIHIDVARVAIDAASTPADQSVTPGDYVRLKVRDNGIGMTPQVQSHLFEPFFTTKEVGQGTGLGLAFVDGIVRRSGGFTTIETAPAKGTAVSAYFPPAAAAVAEEVAQPTHFSSDQRPPGTTILLVEDEEAVRIMTTRVLSGAGYRVLSAATPREACALFERHAAEINLLVTDVVMPDMNGAALAQRLVVRRSDLRVLFVSGYSDAMPVGATKTGRVAFLAKPFPPSDLVTTVAELLDAGVGLGLACPPE